MLLIKNQLFKDVKINKRDKGMTGSFPYLEFIIGLDEERI